MIEGFDLPYPANMLAMIDGMRRRALDRLRYPCERHDLPAFMIDERRKDQMHVIRHDHCDVQIDRMLVFVQAAFQCDVARPLGKNPTAKRAKGEEVRAVVFLNVWKIASVIGFRHRTM